MSSSPFARLFHRKSVDRLAAEAAAGEFGLKRALGPLELIALGIGAIVGAGIFLTVGTAAAGESAVRPGAGPAIVLSFVGTAVACGLCGLCYAEMAAMIPISGSAYTYAYATLGELCAWIIGWDLLIEYAAGNVAVAISWSGYFQALLRDGGAALLGTPVALPGWLVDGYRTASETTKAAAPHLLGVPILLNLPAVAIVLFLTWILVLGVKESSRFNTVMVGVKLVVLLFFVALGLSFFDAKNWFPPDAPSKWAGFAPNGFRGIMTGAAIVFFAYIGFDAVSTAAEEAKNPKRDMPVGILGSLVICTVLYMVVAAVLTGMTSWKRLNVEDPLSVALADKGMRGASAFVAFGSVVAHTAVLLVFQLGQPRIFFSMARDGLLPRWCTAVHPRYRTPHVTTILTGLAVAFFAAFFPIDEIVDLTNIGTLFAFAIVCGGVLVLRVIDPGRPRPFRVRGVWFVAPAGIASCFYLTKYLPPAAWFRFGLWLVGGLILYFTCVVANGWLQSRGVRPRVARAATGAAAALLLAAGLWATLRFDLWNQFVRPAG
ncbi:MAG TPA: amino acid permease [Planctomycetota bacterium]|jgi:APA family basic amino acid/polyamine antiporter|nr:amino acid permease [Planctomycetota bacterium]